MTVRAAILILAACGSHAVAPAPVPVGPQPVVSVAIWPDRWGTITGLKQVREFGVELPASFWDAARLAAEEVGVKSLALPPPGLDTSLPIVAEIAAPRATFETVIAAAARKDLKARRDSAELRVRVTLPAKDVGALATALEAAMPKHARARVVRGDHAVAVDVSFDAQGLHDTPAPPAITVPFDAGHDSAARAAVRLPGLADLGAMTGTLRMVGALAEVEPSQAKAMFVAGTAEVLTGYLLVDPATSMFDALLIDVPLAGNPQAGFELTKAGKTALAAGGLAPGKRTSLATVKWSALLDAMPHAALLAGAKEREVATLFHECGSWCFAYAAMGNAILLAPAVGADNFGALVKKAGDEMGLPFTDVGWTDRLVFVLPAGAQEPSWRVASPALAVSAAETCYRKALLDVRAALKASALDQADAALAGADSCVAADPEVAARHRAMREFVLTLRSP